MHEALTLKVRGAEGMVTLAERYAIEAERLASLEKDGKRKKELERIAETCRRVPAKPARTFVEAFRSRQNCT